MNTPKNTNAFAHVAPSAQPRLETHQATQAATAVPNFVHVGENPYALEAYLRLYFRDWTQSTRGNSSH